MSVPTYPDFPCSKAPLPKGEAPVEGCACRICKWLRENAKVKRA